MQINLINKLDKKYRKDFNSNFSVFFFYQSQEFTDVREI